MTVTRRVAAPAMPTRGLVHRLPAERHDAVSKLPWPDRHSTTRRSAGTCC